MSEQYTYQFGIKAEGRGYDRDGARLERVHETEVLRLMGEEVRQCNVEKGWFDSDRTFGDDIALLHSEVSEMLEAFRTGGTADQTVLIPHDVGMPPKPEGVGSEAADVLVRLLDTCSRHGIDLFTEWRRKVDFNWTRPARHGGKAL